MDEVERAFRISVLLSLQRALWDIVTPDLRGVAVTPSSPIIRARFIYEAVNPDLLELVSEAETTVYADFLPPINVQFVGVSEPLPARRLLEAGEEWFYLRRERPINE